MFMVFQIAEAIHAEREAERNHIFEGITVRKATIAERFMQVLQSHRWNRTARQNAKRAMLTQHNAIAR